MKSAENWVEAFHISPENIAAWSTEVPDGVPLLVWAIREHKIDLGEYLNWASEHFGLPVLESEYFSSGFQLPLTAEQQEKSMWTPWMYPVSTWDDVTLVACFEPPQEPLAGVYAFVLADPQSLQTAWQKVMEGAPLDAPLGLELKAAKGFKLDMGSLGLVEEAPSAPAPQAGGPPQKAKPPAAATPTPLRRRIDLPAPVEEAIQIAFKSLKKDYKSVLFLRKNGSVASSLRWDSSLESTLEPSKIAVDLNFPSFLRIVNKTLQPYHGYVIDSPMHQDFFANLNYEKSPPCVTALPVKVDGALWGLVVAIGDETAQSAEVLHRATVTIEKLSEAIEPAFTGTQAA